MKSLKQVCCLLFFLLLSSRLYAAVDVRDQGESSKIKCSEESHIGNLTNSLFLQSEIIAGEFRKLIFKVEFSACQQNDSGIFYFKKVQPEEVFEQSMRTKAKFQRMKKVITYARFFHTHTGSMDLYSDIFIEQNEYSIAVIANKNLTKLVLGPAVTSSVYNNEDYSQEDYVDFGPAKDIFIYN